MFSDRPLQRLSIHRSSRFGVVGRSLDEQVSAHIAGWELLTIFLAGSVAALAVAFVPMPLRVPGHAILKAALPILFAVAIVPRRGAGSLVGASAALTAGALLMPGMGNLKMAAVASLFAIGPAMDAAISGAKHAGWRLWLRCAMAGLAANTIAFAVRWGAAWFGLQGLGPHQLKQFSVWAYLSFAVCGLLAGLLSAAVCFSGSEKEDRT